MLDPLSWTINLGLWSGVQVRAHSFLALFALLKLIEASLTPGASVIGALGWLAILLVALALHVLAQVAVSARLGVDVDEVRLWPLGNLSGPGPLSIGRSFDAALIAVAGPVMSGIMALIAVIGLHFAGAQMVLNPFGNARVAPVAERQAAQKRPNEARAKEARPSGGPTLRAVEGKAAEAPEVIIPRRGGGTPLLNNGEEAPLLSAVWCVGWFGYLNWVLFLANLIPALPLAAGRFLRAALGASWVGPSRDSMVALHTACVISIVLALTGVLRWLLFQLPGGVELIMLAVVIDRYRRAELRGMEEGGFFEDSVFGYDFSQGYTSLEAGAPKVRPYRESALKRWRRRRSDQRRMQREAKAAAEEARMDEILAKLHQQGPAALSEEEHRFLVRISVRYRGRNRSSH